MLAIFKNEIILQLRERDGCCRDDAGIIIASKTTYMNYDSKNHSQVAAIIVVVNLLLEKNDR